MAHPTVRRARAPRHPSSSPSRCSPRALPSRAPAPGPSAAGAPTRRPRRPRHADAERHAATDGAEIPTDCREILSDGVLAQLGDIPLNDPALRPVGRAGRRQPHLHLGATPRADTTDLTHHDHATCRAGRPSTCSTSSPTTRASPATRPTAAPAARRRGRTSTYPVTDGRTLFWRDDILIDTQFSNLAPSGYTAAIVEHIFG